MSGEVQPALDDPSTRLLPGVVLQPQCNVVYIMYNSAIYIVQPALDDPSARLLPGVVLHTRAWIGSYRGSAVDIN